MTADKPRWWQGWIVYGLVALLLAFGPYVGGYFWLGVYGVIRDGESHVVNCRIFATQVECDVFGPLAWAESRVRGEPVGLMTYEWFNDYRPYR